MTFGESGKDQAMRILLVEDDPSTARAIELMLTAASYNVFLTDMGEEGIDLAKLYDYDLILLDLDLPDMHGMEVLRHRYRKDADRPWVTPLASALQSAHLVYLLGAGFVGIAFQPFIYMLIGAQIGLDSYLAHQLATTAWQPRRKVLATA